MACNLMVCNFLLSASLCNVVMKLVTKIIVNRIKYILSDVIDVEQSVFVKGRLITDNTLIVMKCFHWMKKKKGEARRYDT